MNAGLRKAVCLAGVMTLLALSGCAGVSGLHARRMTAEAPLRSCAQWYADLDAAIDAAGVRDAQAMRIEGFPYLRVDRFSAALREPARAQESMMHALVERLLRLDIEARAVEIANLPASTLLASSNEAGERGATAAIRRTKECGSRLSRFDLDAPEVAGALLDSLRVPDDYVTAYRIAGLYWLSKIPFGAGIQKHIDETNAAFDRDLDASAKGAVIRYSPSSRPHVAQERLQRILERSAENPLKVPEPSAGDLELLFRAYAPSFEVETTGDHDRPGALRWRWGSLPEVDASDPAVYRHVAHTRYKGVNLLQLVYTLWFPERPAQGAADLLAGRLDGVVFRVTLAPDGSPLLYDTMHACGCYHMFFSTPRAAPLPAPAGEPEWAFVPQKLRAMRPDDRIVVRLATGTHYVERVLRDRDDSLARYELRPYDDLRSLPRMQGGSQSVFGLDGFIAGTERAERFLFWPMGIPNAGAMRQWGHHPTAFVGRRHFDDPDLLERRFMLDLK